MAVRNLAKKRTEIKSILKDQGLKLPHGYDVALRKRKKKTLKTKRKTTKKR